jgi:hypothetical protein
MTKTYDALTYVICHNGSDVVHPCEVQPGTNLSSGQPNVEEFTDKEAWKARLAELNYDVSQLDPPALKSMREPPAPIGPRAVERMAERAELANMSPEERMAHRQAQREARMAERANMAKLSPEERKAQRLNARKP